MTYFPNDADIGRNFDDTVLATCTDCGKRATWAELDEDMHNIIGG